MSRISRFDESSAGAYPQGYRRLLGSAYSTGLTYGYCLGYIQREESKDREGSDQSSRIDMKGVKEKIKSYFESRHGDDIDYVDLCNAFPELSLPCLVQACEELEEEGRIAEVD